MQLLLFEYCVSGGVRCSAELAGLLPEGRAMWRAACEDLLAVDGVELRTLVDERLADLAIGLPPGVVEFVSGDPDDVVAALATTCDAALPIAPETGGRLTHLSRLLGEAGAWLLSPSAAWCELAGDKSRTLAACQDHELPIPRWQIVGPGAAPDFDPPYLLKPLEGAGGQGIRCVHAFSVPRPCAESQLATEYVSGVPASVALACGPRGIVALPPFRQLIGPNFAYLGGRRILQTDWIRRAHRLALATVQALEQELDEPPVGYLGVDLLLGPDPGGLDDVVLEVNPRLTTSYLGLRALAAGNLGAWILGHALGEPVRMEFRSSDLCFSADGGLSTR